MYGEIAAIESQTEIKNALVVDKEVEFCALMKFYLVRKNFNVSTSYNLRDALVKIEMEKPEVIIADKTFHPDLQDSLTEKINSITGYSPKIFFVGTYLQEREGPFIYTLKRDYYKKNYHKSPSDFWEEIIQYLKDLFK
jgi:hypothetical protein